MTDEAAARPRSISAVQYSPAAIRDGAARMRSAGLERYLSQRERTLLEEARDE